jgi:membrane protease YdiL (CAAX protease family)
MRQQLDLLLQNRRPAVEALALLVLTFPLAIGFGLPTLWLLAPVAVISLGNRPLAPYGLGWRGWGSPLFHLTVTVSVFVPYALAHLLFEHWRIGAAFHPQLPPDPLRVVFDQVFIVALPEEFFFRGYLQTQLDQAWGKPYRLLGARVGRGMLVAAALFALCHVPFGGPGRLVVFFPGLLYGWLRARTDTIAVPVLYHAASNLLMHFMVLSLH